MFNLALEESIMNPRCCHVSQVPTAHPFQRIVQPSSPMVIIQNSEIPFEFTAFTFHSIYQASIKCP